MGTSYHAKNIPFSEPFLEATPQVHITLVLMGLSGFSPSDVDWLVWTSFGISIISAAFGIAKLLKNGPIKMVRKDGKIGGYGTPGFILLMIVVGCNLVGKATWMALGFGYAKSSGDKVTVLWMWALTCILPQILLVNSQKSYLFKKPYTYNPIFSRPFQYGW